MRSHVSGLMSAGRAQDAVDTLLWALEDLVTESTTKVSGLRSEQVSREQLKLLLDELDDDEPDEPEGDETLQPEDFEPRSEPKKAKRTPHGRRPLPAELPREPMEVRVPAGDVSGRERKLMGHERSEVLELVRAHFKVIVGGFDVSCQIASSSRRARRPRERSSIREWTRSTSSRCSRESWSRWSSWSARS